MKQLFFIGFVFLAASSLNAQTLKPWKTNLPSGKQLNVLNTMDTKITQEVMGQSMEIEMHITSIDSVMIKSETAGSFNLSKVTTKMKMNMTAMGKDVNFDSEKKEDMDGEMGEKLKNKIGVPIEATVTENGKIKITNEKKDEESSDVMGSMMQMNNDSAAIAGLFLTPPPKKLIYGESWKDSLTTPEISVENIYTFDKAEADFAFINFTSINNTSGTVTTSGMEVTLKLKTETTGVMKVNTKTSVVVERKGNMKMSGTSEVMGMQIPINGESVITSTVTGF